MLICSEWIKLIAQLFAALIVAAFTVWLALSRYKREKLWERRLAAYSDIVGALGQMLRINHVWYEDELLRKERDDEHSQELYDDYRGARKRLDETISTGRLLLPQSSQDALARLEQGLDASHSEPIYQLVLENDDIVMQRALNDIILLGRDVLQIPKLD